MLLPLLIILFMPESPRFLVLCGREQQAKSVFSALNELSPDDEDVHREFLMVKHTLLHMASGGIMQAFTMGRCRYAHRTILAVALQIMQQCEWRASFVYLKTLANVLAKKSPA